MHDQPPQQGLTREQKTGFVFLLIFGVLAIGLGFLQMRNTIYSPFIVRSPRQSAQAQNLLNETMRLQNIDTDQDGLNDYEELNFYRTSPYLPDTDSDGITDQKEIIGGTDPLCPAGKDCAVQEAFPTPTPPPIITPLGIESPTPLDIIEDTGQAVLLDSTLIDFEKIARDPDQLRTLLLGTGSIDQEVLDTIDDEALLLVIQELIEEIQ